MQGRHDPRRQRHVAAGRGRHRQAPEDQGRERCCCASPSRRRSALLAGAQKLAAELDPNFLWEVSGDDEFGFLDLAREYFGHAPQPVEAAATAFALHAAPMYFYKRGKGRYRKAPPDALKAALASIERKRREAEQTAAWIAELSAQRLPEALAAKLPMLLYKPDKNTRRVEGAAGRLRRAADQSRRAARALRRHPVDPRVPLPAVPGRGVSAGHRLPALGHAAARAGAAAGAGRARSRSTTTRPPRSTTRSRSATCRTGTTRSASTSPRPRCRFRAGRRSTPRPGRGCPPSTCPGARSPCCPTRRWTRSRWRPARRCPRCRCTPRSAPTAAWSATAPASIACRSPPTCGWTRSATRFTDDLPDRSDPPWNAELRVLWKLVQQALRRARQGRHRPAGLQLLRRLGRRPRRPRVDRAAGARLAGRQARLRADDLRQQHLGQGALRRPRGRALPGPVRRQGEDEHPPRRAPGARSRPLPVGELAAAPLQRSRQPAPAAGGAGRRQAAVRRTTTPSSSPR